MKARRLPDSFNDDAPRVGIVLGGAEHVWTLEEWLAIRSVADVAFGWVDPGMRTQRDGLQVEVNGLRAQVGWLDERNKKLAQQLADGGPKLRGYILRAKSDRGRADEYRTLDNWHAQQGRAVRFAPTKTGRALAQIASQDHGGKVVRLVAKGAKR